MYSQGQAKTSFLDKNVKNYCSEADYYDQQNKNYSLAKFD